MSQALKQYYSQIRQKLAFLEQRPDELTRAAEIMSHSIMGQRNIFVFGASHAGILAEEMSYRAGGLAIINPLFTPALMLNVRPLTLTSAVENVENLGRVLVEQSPLRADDTLLIHSVSGRNAITIDVALAAKACGAKVIAITSLATAARPLPPIPRADPSTARPCHWANAARWPRCLKPVSRSSTCWPLWHWAARPPCLAARAWARRCW